MRQFFQRFQGISIEEARLFLYGRSHTAATARSSKIGTSIL
ncbi:MAG: hypothetical protein ACFB16_25780 [Phormidesmis sp.]